jgi:signal transduction histidine kinase
LIAKRQNEQNELADGTNYSTGGFRRVTRKGPAVQVRLLGFVLLALFGIIVLAYITRTTWTQLDHLQKEHAAVKGESFYLGVHLRGAVRSLNDKLLQSAVTGNGEPLQAFLQESSELKGWIETNRLHLSQMANLRLLKTVEVSGQLQLLEQAQNRYEQYLTNSAHIIAAAGKGKPQTFESIYRSVRDSSAPLFPVCDELVKSQRQSFGEFLGETQNTLIEHQRLLQITSVLIVALALALAIQVYRGMISPLRASLDESKSIIERQEKLASLGILASGVAHEIRNPLTAIKIRLFSLKKAIPAVAEDEDATVIASEITRLEQIVRDFLSFARPSAPKLARIPATQVLKEVQTLMAPQLERMGIDLKLQTANAGQVVHADAPQLKQVLINLVQNSAENIGRNGTVNLGVRSESAVLNGRERAAVVLSVHDTGKGIPPEVEARLFDPFFTTKEGGTGLGLAISARIMEKHGGLLRYETKLNAGTTFEVVVPEVASDGTENSAH